MSNPSWLTEEVVQTAAKNPHVQNAAVNVGRKVAEDATKNPQPYMAAAAAGFNSNTSNEPAWARKPDPSPYGRQNNDIEKQYNTSQPQVLEPGEGMTDGELRDVRKAHFILRFLYMSISICMAAAAVLTLGSASFTGFFIAGYVIFFSVLMCCFETGFGWVAKLLAVNFGFMYSIFGRVFFDLFVAVMCYSLESLFGTIVMAILVAILALHLYIMWRYPKYGRYVRRTHYFAVKRG